MYNFIINKINKVEFKFTNPLKIDLCIGYISLILKSKDCHQVKLKLVDLIEKEKHSFTIPSLAVDYKIEMGIIIENFGRFQFIGIYYLTKI